MRAYMGCSRGMGSEEGAMLVIAKTAKEAKNLAWPDLSCWFDCFEWTDVAIRWLRDNHIMALADQTKLAAGESHVIDSPIGCESCEMWGYDVNPDGTCCGCGQPAGEELIRVLGDWRKRQQATTK